MKELAVLFILQGIGFLAGYLIGAARKFKAERDLADEMHVHAFALKQMDENYRVLQEDRDARLFSNIRTACVKLGLKDVDADAIIEYAKNTERWYTGASK